MELRNPLSRFQADQLYQPLSGAVQQRDLQDNNTEYIIVGQFPADNSIRIPYSFQMPISGRVQSGLITITADSSGAAISNHFDFVGGDTQQIDSVDFFADINGNDVRLIVITLGLGEHPTLKYRTESIAL